jgi:hypothetical protein
MSRLLKLRRCCVHLAAGEAQREPLTPRHTKLVFCDQSIETTEAWIDQNRRMSKDYERLPESGEAFIYVAMSRLMTRRLARS